MNIDEKMMKKCFKLASKAGLNTYMNPLVGAVLCGDEGEVLAEGYHKKYGEAHAEANCLNSYKGDFSNTTLYVNLEPCSHIGKTPPCADLIIKKGIKRVVVAMEDPNPKVNGRGLSLLKKAGIEVTVGVLEHEARELNKVFLKNILKKKPYVTTKIATTLDGKIATENWSSKWITGDNARSLVRKIRDKNYAVMTAAGTVLADNPHFISEKTHFARIILDNKGKIPSDFNVFKDNGSRIIYITNKARKMPKHVEIMPFENLDTLFRTLLKMGFPSILVEAGAGLNSELIKNKEIDYIFQFISPKICGRGLSYADKISISDINLSKKIKIKKTSKIDEDILLEGEFII